MAKISVNTADSVVPMIYAYSTPEIARHNGWTKIGYTEQNVDKRIKQQSHTYDGEYKKEWQGNAVFEDGSGDVFSDSDFHAYLKKLNIERKQGTEWFKITGPDSKAKFQDFKENRGIVKWTETTVPYKLREEQEQAVEKTVSYYSTSTKGEFLWNAKPRFGKTLSVYDFCKRIDAQNVLIVTNRPAIANSWYSDYIQFLGEESGYLFVSSTDSLKNQTHVLSRDEYMRIAGHKDAKCIEFLSLQDLKGSIYFGGQFDKLKEISLIDWDVLVIDEAHEGVDTTKTNIAFNKIKRKFTLHLSGTPFKALANEKFNDAAIFNWTYADEQTKKAEWDESSEEENPYANLPKLNMFTYQMSEIVRDELDRGIEIQGETEEYAFDLGEFFSTDSRGAFVHSSSVDKFLDALTTKEKYPFSTEELRGELKHTFWLLDRVASAEALKRKLENHPIFKDYKVVLAAGSGKVDDDDYAEATEKAFNRVKQAIAASDKTITLSVGQLTTGVTIPEWTAVLMLTNIKSPSLYMQAAFRAQNPCLFHSGASYYRKKNAYVFDFDPARTLIVYEKFANDLSADTADGRGDSETRKKNIKRLLNFFPVLGEDDDGEMIELDAAKVLSIPRKIKSQEVVRRGFMSNYLFQNIANIYSAPKAVTDILKQFPAVPEPKEPLNIDSSTKEDLSLNENGDVDLNNEYVIGTASDAFGGKIFENIDEVVDVVVSETAETINNENSTSAEDKLKQALNDKVSKVIIDTIEEKYGSDVKPSDKKQLERNLHNGAQNLTDKLYGDFNIEKNVIDHDWQQALQNRFASGKTTDEIDAEYKDLQDAALSKFEDTLKSSMAEYIVEATQDAVRTVETNIKEREKKTIEDTVKDHLRGFARTIPSFLMAYGNADVTLYNFDEIIPDDVFVEVTSISLEQFRFLRDGGEYIEEETGESKHFNGNLFDPVVFNDSVQEFLRLKKELGNYFAEDSTEDIFDYIPPQRTNQIYTPKRVVQSMADMLEEEEPGCFDRDDKTFIDLYMKSGLYITEIVKRLYKSDELKRLYPSSKDRLDHIFEKQVYGLAPTEIIFNIAKSYIFGFEGAEDISQDNFKKLDALVYAKEGTLSEKLDEVFGGESAEAAPEKKQPAAEKAASDEQKKPEKKPAEKKEPFKPENGKKISFSDMLKGFNK